MAFNIFATAVSDIPLANLDANFTLIGAAAAVSTLYPTASTSITYGTAGTTHYLSGTGLSVAGAATVGTTLGVTGTSTMAAINASGNVTVTKGVQGDAFFVLGIGSRGVSIGTDTASATAYMSTTNGTTALGLGVNGGFAALTISTTGAVSIPGTTTGTGFIRSLATSNTVGTPTFYLSTSMIREGADASFNVDTFDGAAYQNRLKIVGATGAVTIPGTLGVTSTVEAGLTISRSTDATCAIYLNRSGGANSWAMYRYGSSASDKFAIGRPGASEDFTITTAGIVTMGAYGAGAATFSSAGVISSVSDERLKIKDGTIADPIPMMMALEPGYYFGKPEANMGDGRQLGFYAQNVRKAIGPEAAPDPEDQVNLDADGNEVSRTTRPWGYYDRSVLAVAIEALKVHEGRLAVLQADFQAYKNSHP